MGSSSIRRLLLTLALATLSSAAWAQNLANVIFLEPVGAVDTRGAEIRASMPLYRRVADPARYTPWLENQSARYALRLYRAAYEIAHPNDGTPDYYVALVPGGNHAAVGFRVQTGERIATPLALASSVRAKSHLELRQEIALPASAECEYAG